MKEETEAAVRQVTGMVEAFSSDDKFMPAIAKMCKKLFDSLIEEGFSETEAMQIVANFKLA